MEENKKVKNTKKGKADRKLSEGFDIEKLIDEGFFCHPVFIFSGSEEPFTFIYVL